MSKSKYLLESEVNPWKINEEDYRKRRIVDQCLNNYILGRGKSKRKVKPLIKEQQIVLKEYLEYILAEGKLKSAYSIQGRIALLHKMSLSIGIAFNIFNLFLALLIVPIRTQSCINNLPDYRQRIRDRLSKK